MKKRVIWVICFVAFCFCFIKFSDLSIFEGVKAESEWTIEGTMVLSYNGKSSKVEVPFGMTAIGEGAFEENRIITEVVLPETLQSIGIRAFRGCSSLSSINLENITSYGEMAFEATAIQSVTLNSDVPLGLFAYGKLNYVKMTSNVTSIGNNAFYSCYQLTTVVMSDNIYSIGAQAFMGCKLLKDVALPKSLTSIGSKCFYETGIVEVDVPGTVEELPGLVFGECTSLMRITLHNGLKKIASNMIIDTLITSITIPSSVEEIGWFAVTGNSYLKSIHVEVDNKYYSSDNGVLYNHDYTKILSVPFAYPESILVVHEGCIESDERFASSLQNVVKVILPSTFKSIYYRAFYNSLKLEEVILPDGLEKIYAGAFSYCKLLQKITIPESVTFMGDSEMSSLWSGGVFAGCSMLKEVILPKNLVSLSSFAFQDCSSLERVYIPKGVESVGKLLFKGCSSLKVVEVEDGNPVCFTKDGVYYEVVDGINYLSVYPASKEGTTYTTPSTITHIKDGCFDSCRYLKEVVLSKEIISFGEEVFRNTTGLSKVTFLCDIETLPDATFLYSSVNEVILPSSLKVLGVRSFAFCKNLKSIVLPEGLLTIQSMAFYDSGLENLVMPDTVTSIDQAFMNCKSLVSIHLSDALKSMNASSFNGSKITEITIPSSLVVVPDYAFYNCQYLTTVNLPKTITSFSMACFGNCPLLTTINVDSENKYIKELDGILYNEDFTKLLFVNKTSDVSEIVLPATLIEVPQGSFTSDTRVKVITIPGSITTYGYRAFYNAGFEKVIFSEGVKTIPGFLFASCHSLKEVVLPSTLESLESAAFAECTVLERVVIPEGCSIKSGFSLFKNCVNLTEVVIPKSATVIPQYMFVGCIALQTITIPESVTRIEMNAFEGCLSLTFVIIPSSVETLEVNAFKDSGVKCIYFMGNAPVFVASQYGVDYYPLDSVLYMDKASSGFKTLKYQKYSKQFVYFSDGMFNDTMEVDCVNIGENNVLLTVDFSLPCTHQFYQMDGENEILLSGSVGNEVIVHNLIGGKSYDFKISVLFLVGNKIYRSSKLISKVIAMSKSDYEKKSFESILPSLTSIENYSLKELEYYVNLYQNLSEDVKTYILENTSYQELYKAYSLKKAYEDDINKITEISFSEQTVTINLGDTHLLNVIFPDGVENKQVAFTSNNNDIVSISETGLVSACALGTCVVTGTALNGVSTTITINVVKQPQTAHIGLVITLAIIALGAISTGVILLFKKRGYKDEAKNN